MKKHKTETALGNMEAVVSVKTVFLVFFFLLLKAMPVMHYPAIKDQGENQMCSEENLPQGSIN